ncbi:isocitrate lyase/PEP mutase family protein [Limibacterium fermenti]|uniref:isocitrate lyase/PEP mutase family protein n=1 Tax=Limibacterium fermenti TaxID=3229863 RepID=UPI0026AD9401
MSKRDDFKKLHAANEPFILANVWDVKSAQIAEKAGYKAVGVSGHAVAETFGYADGEDMSFEELLYMAKRIASSLALPVSVDIDGGYSRDVKEIQQHVKQLTDIGVVGINIEDSVVTNGNRKLADVAAFADTIRSLRQYIDQQTHGVFLNIRIDTYVVKHPQAFEETLSRVKLYEAAGADGVFVPAVTKEKEIAALVDRTSLPFNAFLLKDTPDFNTLKELGVKRISCGAALHAKSYKEAEKLYKELLDEKRFDGLF